MPKSESMRKWAAALAILCAMFVGAGLRGQSLRASALGFCAISSPSAATKITSTSCVFASFTGEIAGTTLTASSVTGSIIPGQPLIGTGITSGTLVTGVINAPTPGGAGTYAVNNSQTVTSESMTTAGVPPIANYLVACAYTQAVNWRDDLTAPTATVGTGGQGIPAGNCIPYNSAMMNWQVIQQTANAVVGLTFYLLQ